VNEEAHNRAADIIVHAVFHNEMIPGEERWPGLEPRHTDFMMDAVWIGIDPVITEDERRDAIRALHKAVVCKYVQGGNGMASIYESGCFHFFERTVLDYLL
jgi:hypothetical protein